MPTSHIEQPRRSSSRITPAVKSKSGSPAVTNGMRALRLDRRRSAKSWSRRDISGADILVCREKGHSTAGRNACPTFEPCNFRRILIPTAGKANDDNLILAHLSGLLHRAKDGVRAFEGGQNAFVAGQG